MKNGMVKKALKLGAKGLLHTLGFTLSVIADTSAASAKSKKHNPTLHETMCGEKMPLSDKYFVPDDKFPK